jgi:hypothetical protein
MRVYAHVYQIHLHYDSRTYIHTYIHDIYKHILNQIQHTDCTYRSYIQLIQGTSCIPIYALYVFYTLGAASYMHPYRSDIYTCMHAIIHT